MKTDKLTTVAFAAHSPKKIQVEIKDLCEQINAVIIHYYQQGFRAFISTVEAGFECLASEQVIKLKEHYPDIQLICVIPFSGGSDQLDVADKLRYEAILKASDSRIILSEDNPAGFFLFEYASELIAFHDTNEEGNTSDTIMYATNKGIPVLNLFDTEMTEFTFHRDEKLKVWGRTTFEVKGFTYKQALESIRLLKFQDIYDLESQLIVPLSHIYIIEGTETLSLIENKGMPTIEYYSDDDLKTPIITNRDDSVGDDRRSGLNELACMLAEKNMVDSFRMLPEEFMDKDDPEVYAEVYQNKFDALYDFYYAKLEAL